MTKITIDLNDPALLELLADLEHKQWSHLIKYLWSKNYLKKLGLPMERYRQLVKTPYSSLREHEKDSDKEWAKKVLRILAVFSQG